MADDLSSSSYNQHSTALAVLTLIDIDGLSYEDYFKKVEEMIGGLRQYWKLEQRVKALKVAIQLTKLLADTSQMKLYSKKFKLITDVLDEFGRLIYLRIGQLASGGPPKAEEESLGTAYSYTSQPSTTIGHLIVHKNNTITSATTNNVDTDDDLDRAKETCRNWFLKIASIRELVPRFYNELAILKVCDFLLKNRSGQTKSPFAINEEQFYSQSLKRLTTTAWGFGDPIVAIHARAYLCKVASRLISLNTSDDDSRIDTTLFDIIMLNLEASSTLITRLDSKAILKMLQHQNHLDPLIFFDLISNALQAILNLVTLRHDIYTDDDNFSPDVCEKFEKMFNCLIKRVGLEECSQFSRNILIHSALRALPGDICAKHSVELHETIRATHRIWKQSIIKNDDDVEQVLSAADTQMITSTLYATINSFSLALDGSDYFELESDSRLKSYIMQSICEILEDLYNYEIRVNSTIKQQYLQCFKAWFSYAHHYSVRSLEMIDEYVSKFIIKIKKDRQYIQQHVAIVDLIKILIANKRTLDELKLVVVLKSFMQLLGLLSKDDHKLEASKWILETIRANLKINKQEPFEISDRILINFILRLSSIINDSLNLLTPNEDLEHLSQLVIYFLEKISIQDYRDHLEFFSRSRGSLGNLDLVLEYLARRSLRMFAEFEATEKKRSVRRNYLNGCLAFTFVTIPALKSPLTRLNLFIEGSKLALTQMSLSLADYYLKQALANINEQLHISGSSVVESSETVKNDDGNRYGRSSSFNGIITTAPTNRVSKPLLDQIHLILNLFLDYEDHIDLKHKLTLSSVIKNSALNQHADILQLMNRIITVDDDDDDATIEQRIE